MNKGFNQNAKSVFQMFEKKTQILEVISGREQCLVSVTLLTSLQVVKLLCQTLPGGVQ